MGARRRTPGAGRSTARRFGITARLMALALVPIFGLLLFAVPTLGDRLLVADRAERVRAEVDHLTGLTALRLAVHRERVPVQAAMRSSSVGIDSSQAGALLGMDVDARLAHDAETTDSAVQALGDETPITLDEVRELRRRAAGNQIDPDDYLAALEDFDARLVADSAVELAEIRAQPIPQKYAAVLEDGLDALRWSSVAVEASNGQLNSVMWLSLGNGDPRTLTNDLAAATADQTSVTEQLNLVTTPAIKDAWASVLEAPSTHRYQATVTGMLRDGPPAVTLEDGIEQIASVSRDGLAFQESVFAFAETVTVVIRDVASEMRTTTLTDVRRTVAVTGVLVMAIVGISLMFGRSISRPLRRLAQRASALSAGDLPDDISSASTGPRDVVVTAAAFDDLVANLRLLEAKAQALATGDFDAPALAETVPGPLGESLQASAELLSGSIGEREALQRRLAHDSTHDPLTGLHNRAAIPDLLNQVLARAHRQGTGVAVVAIDLDGFQRANDTLGHRVGDSILREVARRLRSTVRSGEVTARVGSDEFVVIAEQVDDVHAAGTLARRLQAAVEAPIDADGTSLETSACLGISLALDHRSDPEQLVTAADLALQRARTRGPGNMEVFDEEAQRRLVEQAELEDALTDSLRRDDLFLQYQPVLDLADDRFVSAEALLRWDRPGVGRQPPDTFIPVAEASNLIVDIDRWVLRQAAKQLSSWSHHPQLRYIDLAVNISGRHLRTQRLNRHIDELLQVSDIDPTQLVIEVTETVLLDDIGAVARQLRAVRDRGIRVAIDDFGTGFTSITHLQHLPADILKIDRAFVGRASHDRDRRLLAMVTDLGHHLGMTITAEGVETADQLDVLRELGCDHAQGYLISRPLDVPDIERWSDDAARSFGEGAGASN